MENIHFYKFHGTGNDFVLIDNRDNHFKATDNEFIRFMCHRRFGIGADGFMLLESSADYAFFMRYYNSDGNESTMCGNGGRSIVAFAEKLGIVSRNVMFEFEAIDGIHHAVISDSEIKIKMQDVHGIDETVDGYFLNTGSPHVVSYNNELDGLDVFSCGRNIRNNPIYGKGGTNVNFVRQDGEGNLSVRTYERGVEDETWACGTGCVASVLTDYYINGKRTEYNILVKGGELRVRFTPVSKGVYTDVWLEGPAKFVFDGYIIKEIEA